MTRTKVMFAGGGTGGHVYPAIAMYEAMKERAGDLEVVFVGVRGGMEGSIMAENKLPLKQLSGRGLRGASMLRRLASPFVFLRSLIEAVGVIRRFQPDVVVGTGGYASASIVVAARLSGKPIVLQEQNSVPGLVNRRLARFADLVLLSFEESAQWIPAGVATIVAGNPVRRRPECDRRSARQYFGLREDVVVVGIMGGSRGARSVNEAACDAIDVLVPDTNTQFILLTGAFDYERVSDRMQRHGDRVVVMAHLEDVHRAYDACDLFVARAGASSVFELAAAGVPTIFVPYPHAADDHQAKNVERLSQDQAVVVIPDAELDGRRLANEIRALLDDPQRCGDMSQALRGWARPGAADTCAESILELVKKKRMSDTTVNGRTDERQAWST